jgi:hypothetical protein
VEGSEVDSEEDDDSLEDDEELELETTAAGSGAVLRFLEGGGPSCSQKTVRDATRT